MSETQSVETKPVAAHIIWFLDNTYTECYGTDQKDALDNYLANVARSIRATVPASDYSDILPPQQYVPSPTSALWPEHAPCAIVPLYHPSQWSRK